jgi:hypothetical protein
VVAALPEEEEEEEEEETTNPTDWSRSGRILSLPRRRRTTMR